jgi:hypothetical protein
MTLAIVLGSLCFFLGLAILVAVLFFLTLQKALGRCAPPNRTMEPGMVWLNLIPLFGFFWMFKTVICVGDSLKHEFADRNLDYGSDYGKSLGLWMAALQLCGTVMSNIGRVAGSRAPSAIGGLLSLVAIVLFIIYWVRIAGFSRTIAAENDRRYERMDDDAAPPPERFSGITNLRPWDDRIR